MSTAGRLRAESGSGPGPGAGGRAAAPLRKGTPDATDPGARPHAPASRRSDPAADLADPGGAVHTGPRRRPTPAAQTR